MYNLFWRNELKVTSRVLSLFLAAIFINLEEGKCPIGQMFLWRIEWNYFLKLDMTQNL